MTAPTIADAYAGARAMRALGVSQSTGLDCHWSNYGDEASPYERTRGIGAQDYTTILGRSWDQAGARWAEALRGGPRTSDPCVSAVVYSQTDIRGCDHYASDHFDGMCRFCACQTYRTDGATE